MVDSRLIFRSFPPHTPYLLTYLSSSSLELLGTKEPMHTPLRLAARADLMEVFNKAKGSHTAGLNRITLLLASEMLGYSLSEQEVEDCIQYAKGKGGVSSSCDHDAIIVFEVFEEWWNSDRCNEGLRDLKRSKLFVHQQVEGTGALFG